VEASRGRDVQLGLRSPPLLATSVLHPEVGACNFLTADEGWRSQRLEAVTSVAMSTELGPRRTRDRAPTPVPVGIKMLRSS